MASFITTVESGHHINDATRQKIIAMLTDGRHPVITNIARACKVSPSTIHYMLKKDPELRDRYETALAVTANEIENAAVDMCLDERTHPMARGKMIEFMLPRLNPTRYGEQAQTLGLAGQAVKRIAIVAEMPVIETDANGIPIAKSQSPLEPEVIEAKTVSPE